MNEAETTPDHWSKVDVTVGAPAGKTKTILVDLTHKLPPGTRRLRVSAAFEIHWDRLALFEQSVTPVISHTLSPQTADLHWRGYSELSTRSWQHPLIPDYLAVRQDPPWRITPSGWCTRYGSVPSLVSAADDALALIAGGDELTLSFAANALPPKAPGQQRDFFLFTVGWDKDADFHCVDGWRVEPLPWRAMDSSRYGQQARPSEVNSDWIKQFNTRWVGPRTLAVRRQK